MKIYKPPKRLVQLSLMLQYDSYRNNRFLSFEERWNINHERAKLLKNDEEYWQSDQMEQKIQDLLDEIKSIKWQPLNKIEYVSLSNHNIDQAEKTKIHNIEVVDAEIVSPPQPSPREGAEIVTN